MISYPNSTNDFSKKSISLLTYDLTGTEVYIKSFKSINDSVMNDFQYHSVSLPQSFAHPYFNQDIYPAILVECVQVPIGHFSRQYENFNCDINPVLYNEDSSKSFENDCNKYCVCSNSHCGESSPSIDYCDCHLKIHKNYLPSDDVNIDCKINLNQMNDSPANNNQKLHGSQEELTPSYHCTYEGCNKMFYKKWNLSLHMKIHLRNKPFKCEYCSKTFVQKCNFSKHMRTHLVPVLKERKVFKCNICCRKYTQKYNLKVRFQINHANFSF